MNKLLSKDPTSIINSVLFLLIGIILFTYGDDIISVISYILGVVVIIIGVVKTLNATKNNTSPNYNANLALGIMLIVLGIALIFCGPIIKIVLRFFIGAWILVGGANKLIAAINLKKESKDWIKLLVISILLLVIGLYVVLKSLGFKYIGLVMIIYSVIAIVGYFMTPKPKNADVITK